MIIGSHSIFSSSYSSSEYQIQSKLNFCFTTKWVGLSKNMNRFEMFDSAAFNDTKYLIVKRTKSYVILSESIFLMLNT